MQPTSMERYRLIGLLVGTIVLLAGLGLDLGRLFITPF